MLVTREINKLAHSW